jgi:hypothetical protein
VKINQSNILALVRDYLHLDSFPDWYMKEALSDEHLAQSGGSYWVDFRALNEVSAFKRGLESNRIKLAEGVEMDAFLKRMGDDHDRERIFVIVGTRMEYVEDVALVCALPIADTCRIRIGLTELDPPVTRLIKGLADHILTRTSRNQTGFNLMSSNFWYMFRFAQSFAERSNGNTTPI